MLNIDALFAYQCAKGVNFQNCFTVIRKKYPIMSHLHRVGVYEHVYRSETYLIQNILCTDVCVCVCFTVKFEIFTWK